MPIVNHKVTWSTYVSIACRELKNPTTCEESKREYEKTLMQLARYKDEDNERRESYTQQKS